LLHLRSVGNPGLVKIYQRPLALFFFPKPPEEETIGQLFRTSPEYELERIPPRMHLLLRKARVLQLNLAELYDAVNPADRNILRDLACTTTITARELAEKWDETDDALKHWRTVLEEQGVFVFKDSFNPPGRKRADTGDSLFSGFCLYDREVPIIYINNTKPKTCQIFTLFHELAHLLMHTSGVDTRQSDYIEYLMGNDKRIEMLCNQFAAEFLVPSQDFDEHSNGIPINDRAIEDWAKLYCVSRETVLRKLLDRGLVDQRYYEENWGSGIKNDIPGIEDIRITSTWEVFKELSGRKDALSDWCRTNQRIFVTPTVAELSAVREIFAAEYFQAKGTPARLRPVADPFVVARARCLEEGCVVTTESNHSNAAKILNVCHHFKIDCTDLEGFMEREDWRF